MATSCEDILHKKKKTTTKKERIIREVHVKLSVDDNSFDYLASATEKYDELSEDKIVG